MVTPHSPLQALALVASRLEPWAPETLSSNELSCSVAQAPEAVRQLASAKHLEVLLVPVESVPVWRDLLNELRQTTDAAVIGLIDGASLESATSAEAEQLRHALEERLIDEAMPYPSDGRQMATFIGLEPAEKTILAALAERMTEREIAVRMGISRRQVDMLTEQIYQKLGDPGSLVGAARSRLAVIRHGESEQG